jgi:hypothetical protein
MTGDKTMLMAPTFEELLTLIASRTKLAACATDPRVGNDDIIELYVPGEMDRPIAHAQIEFCPGHLSEPDFWFVNRVEEHVASMLMRS